MKINMRLLPIKAHFFLIFAGVAPMLPFLPVYIRQQGISPGGIGLIYTVLPFTGLLAKAGSGLLSDWLRVHRAVFLSAVVVCALGFFSIYFCPPMPLKPDPKPAHVTLTCDPSATEMTFCSPSQRCGQEDFLNGLTDAHVVTCQIDCQLATEEAGKEKKVITDMEEMKEGEEKRLRRASKDEERINNSNNSDDNRSTRQGSVDNSDLCKAWGVAECPAEHLNFTFTSDVVNYVKRRHCTSFPLYNVTVADVQLTNPTCPSTSTTTTNTTYNITTKCNTTCDYDDLMVFLGAPPTSPPTAYEEVLSYAQFWLHLLCMVIAWCGLAITVVMSDTICFQLLGPQADKYGQQRLFGSLGWGTLVVITGALIDYASEGKAQKDYTPAFVISLAILFVDLLAATRLEVEGREKQTGAVAGAVVRLVCEPRVVLFILCCVVVGVSTGILWTYQLMLVEDIAFTWDCHFARLKLLQGLIMGVQCFGGELPFFFLSGWFIRKLGHAFAMSLVIGVFGLRYVLYYTVSNPWWFLPIELLNGFTFGIFYATMTSYASHVAPPGSEATLQGIVGAAFEGIGVATGGFVGGALFFTVGGSRMFLYTGIFNLLFTVTNVALHLLLNRCRPLSTPAGGGSSPGGYVPPSDSMRPVAATEEDLDDGM